MAISIFDIFTVGIGPSSSHTVGPMRATNSFLEEAKDEGVFDKIDRVIVELYGSLGMTGRGHGSDRAVLLGLEGETPESIDPELMIDRVEAIKIRKKISLLGVKEIAFDFKKDLLFKRKALPYHPNGIVIQAFNGLGEEIFKKIYYSIGGGFVVEEGVTPSERKDAPFDFQNTEELLTICRNGNFRISEVMMSNELVWLPESEIREKIQFIWKMMKDSIRAGYEHKGMLPGGLKVKRRAPHIYEDLKARGEYSLRDPLTILDWVNLYALAVNEENAAGGRVVTAPTNGAAGIIPAVLNYFMQFCPVSCEEKVEEFLLTAAAIAILYKKNASISGADVGCQGEVGVACSMAAGALTAALGGTIEQVENAAEIAMEHNLGLTCDPVGGLVQVPCIERNAMGAVKAINASRMAFRGDGKHFVSLDQVIKTMWQTGKDMNSRYKETSRGGLAVNIVEC